MEILSLVIIWPFLIIILGVIFIAIESISGIVAFWAALIFIFGIYFIHDRFKEKEQKVLPLAVQLEEMRRVIITLSIALLIPLFAHSLINTANKSLPVVVGEIIISFGTIVIGLFTSNKVITYSSLIGGAMALVYGYSQIWNLSDLARVIAAGSGLLLAVIIAGIKLKDRL